MKILFGRNVQMFGSNVQMFGRNVQMFGRNVPRHLQGPDVDIASVMFLLREEVLRKIDKATCFRCTVCNRNCSHVLFCSYFCITYVGISHTHTHTHSITGQKS
jgi:hypothetical protein